MNLSEARIAIGKRLQEERQRLGYNQTEFGDLLGVHRKTQANYETGERSFDADYITRVMYATSADMIYVLTGFKGSLSTGTDNAEEQNLLKMWRLANADTRAVALRILRS
jgi:transcriptional regulator with XRE-family HTH domain